MVDMRKNFYKVGDLVCTRYPLAGAGETNAIGIVIDKVCDFQLNIRWISGNILSNGMIMRESFIYPDRLAKICGV